MQLLQVSGEEREGVSVTATVENVAFSVFFWSIQVQFRPVNEAMGLIYLWILETYNPLSNQ